MKHLAILCGALLLLAGTGAGLSQTTPKAGHSAKASAQGTQKAQLDSVVQFLLTSAATDFHTHGPKGPLRFRHVRLGHVVSSSDGNRYLLTGQFLQTGQGAKSKWTVFTTIKTSGYEQWLGGPGSSFTLDPSFRWDRADDLTPRLQALFDSLK
jgi:hypothetical protein